MNQKPQTRNNMWTLKQANKAINSITVAEKAEIEDQCQPLLTQFKSQFINANTAPFSDNIIDIYTNWYRNYLYFCEQIKSDHPNSIKKEYELKFVRLERTEKDKFTFSYFRHTG